MNNYYENSNYLSNYYNNDSNYYTFNDTNDKRFDSLYDNSYSNFDYKIASNIASNYRQCSSGWPPNWGYPQMGQNSYYEPNYAYNRLEPMNGYSTPTNEVDFNHNHFQYTDNQNNTNDNVFKPSFDYMIPVSVLEAEQRIKTERDNEERELVIDETRSQDMDGFQTRPEILEIGDDSNSCGQPFEQNENKSLNEKIETTVEMQSTSKPQRIKRKNRKLMTYEELKRDKRESNRMAATKCRQKKLLQLDALEKISKQLIEENDRLEQQLNEMKVQVFDSKLSLIYHRNNGCLLNAFRN